MLEVVEDDEAVGEHEREVGQPELVGVGVAERLDRAHEVVAEEADGPARERRQVAQRRLAVAADLARGELVGVALVAQRPAHDGTWAQADERVAPDALALLGRLEQEGGRGGVGAAQLEERRDRRLAVVDEGVAQRHEVVLARQLADLGRRRVDGQRRGLNGDGH